MFKQFWAIFSPSRSVDQAEDELKWKEFAADVTLGLTWPLLIWIPLTKEFLNVFCKSPPQDVSPVLNRHVRKLHAKCLIKPFNVYHQEKLDAIKAAMPGYKQESYNLALCGETRVGKSSLCNALLGVRDTDPDAAKVGVVECTTAPTLYRSSQLPHLYIWDMPGAGTQQHSSEEYYNQKHLYACDGLLLVTKDTIRRVDADIIKQAQDVKQRVAIVRTHAQQQLENMMMSLDINAAAAASELRLSATNNMVKELQRCGALAVEIFLVDRWAFCVDNYYQNKGMELTGGLMDEAKLLSWLMGLQRSRAEKE